MSSQGSKGTAGARPVPHRGEVWLAELSPTQGHEQGGSRPVLIVSRDDFNAGPADLVMVLPITSKLRGLPTRVRVEPPEGGLRMASEVLCDQIRTISTQRLLCRLGAVEPSTLRDATTRLAHLLDL